MVLVVPFVCLLALLVMWFEPLGPPSTSGQLHHHFRLEDVTELGLPPNLFNVGQAPAAEGV